MGFKDYFYKCMDSKKNGPKRFRIEVEPSGIHHVFGRVIYKDRNSPYVRLRCNEKLYYFEMYRHDLKSPIAPGDIVQIGFRRVFNETKGIFDYKNKEPADYMTNEVVDLKKFIARGEGFTFFEQII